MDGGCGAVDGFSPRLVCGTVCLWMGGSSPPAPESFTSPVSEMQPAFSPWGGPAPVAFDQNHQHQQEPEEDLGFDPEVTAQMAFPPYLEGDLKKARELIDRIPLNPTQAAEGGLIFAGLVDGIRQELEEPEEPDGPRGEDYEPRRPVLFKKTMANHSREVYQFIRSCRGLTYAVMRASADPSDRAGARIIAEKIAAISAALGGLLHTFLEYPWKTHSEEPNRRS